LDVLETSYGFITEVAKNHAMLIYINIKEKGG